MMNGLRLEERIIFIGNDCDLSFTKPPQMKHMRIVCIAPGAVNVRMEKMCGRDFGISCSL
jgi:hypothetical protein